MAIGHGSQTVIWTALPNGGQILDTRLRLSIHVAPRLTVQGAGPATLGDQRFADFIDWPASIGALAFDVFFKDGPVTLRTLLPRKPTSTGDSALWRRLFGPQTPVRSRVPENYSARRLRSWPVGRVADWILGTYQRIAARYPDDHPPADVIADALAPLNLDRSIQVNDSSEPLYNILTRQIDGMLRDRPALPAGYDGSFPDPTGLDFAQLRRFFDRWAPPPLPAPQPPPPVTPDLEFHDAVGLLGDHPVMMRKLGLVLDVEVPLVGTLAALIGAVLRPVDVWVQPRWTTAVAADGRRTVTTNFTPRTRSDLQLRLLDPVATFVAEPQSSRRLQGGQVPLANGDYRVVEFDAGGAGLAVMNAATAGTQRSGEQRHDTETGTLPSLRSTGLALIETDRAVTLNQRFGRHAQVLEAAIARGDNTVVLYAEDLTRGFAIDVWDDESRGWHSLCARTGTFRVGTGTPVGPINDEGVVSLGATEPPPGQADPGPFPDNMYVGETAFVWDGWSLVARRPGGKLQRVNDAAVVVQDDPFTAPHPAFPFSAAYTARALPRLRYGTNYSFRARAMDIAGNVVVPEPFGGLGAAPGPGNAVATPLAPHPLARFEPVLSPAVVPRVPPRMGESVATIVLRSDYDRQPGPDELVQAERHVLPPVTTAWKSELHKRFDKYSGPTFTGVDAVGSHAILKARDGEVLPKDPVNDTKLPVTYLADWFARGAALRGLPGATDPVKVDFGPTWPGRTGFRLTLTEGSTAPTVDGTGVTRALNVRIPKATDAYVNLSCYLDDSSAGNARDLEQLAIWQLLEDADASSLRMPLDQLRRLAADGGHWMITPWRVMRVIHAVRRPLIAPSFANAAIDPRAADQTSSALNGDVLINPASTSQVEVQTHWIDDIDTGTGPLQQNERRHVVTLDIDHPSAGQAAEPFPFGPIREEYHDTRARTLDLSAVATTRFTEFFVETTTFQNGIGPGSHQFSPPYPDPDPDKHGVVPGSETVSSVMTDAVTHIETTVTYQRDLDYHIDYFNGTLAGNIGRPIVGVTTPIKVSFVKKPIVRRSTEPTGKPVTIDIPATTRPQAAKVRTVLPTWGWQASENGPMRTRTRFGDGLRLYLERPWWSSGNGELLAVLLPDESDRPGMFALNPDLTEKVSEWAGDHRYYNRDVDELTPERFLNRSGDAKSGLALPGLDSHTVTAVPHEVDFDGSADVNAWWSDIVIYDDSGAYGPAVRLVVARYQPNAIPGCELSSPVATDIVFLSGDRTATVTRNNGATPSFTVTVSGQGFGKGAKDNVVEAVLQSKSLVGSTPSDPEVGWNAVVKTVNLVYNGLVYSAVLSATKLAQTAYRIVITEYEQGESNTRRRPVYVDTFAF